MDLRALALLKFPLGIKYVKAPDYYQRRYYFMLYYLKFPSLGKNWKKTNIGNTIIEIMNFLYSCYRYAS